MPVDEAGALEMGNRPRHRLPRGTDHLRKQPVAHGEVDADAVTHDTRLLDLFERVFYIDSGRLVER